MERTLIIFKPDSNNNIKLKKDIRYALKKYGLPDSEIIWKLYNLFRISPAVVLKDKNTMLNEISSLLETTEENSARIIDIIKQI